MADETRYCACGCGEVLTGSKRQRFAGEAHRSRFRKAHKGEACPPAPSTNSGATQNDDGRGFVPSDGEGKVLASIEEWVREHPDLPAPLVASAKALATQVDKQPASPPLWGRLSTVLMELVSPVIQQVEWSREIERAIQFVALAGHDEQWRLDRYHESLDAGEAWAEGWLRVVPISCAQQRHRWRRPGNACVYCGVRREP
jgi:hypothetical protein